MISSVMKNPKKIKVFKNQILLELEKTGLNSIGLVVIKADDQSKIKVNDKIFVITENYFIEFT